MPAIIILVLFLASPVYSQTTPNIDALNCSLQIVELLDKWNSANQWRRGIHDQAMVYSTPTKRTGVWLELRIYGRNAELIRISSNHRVRVRWSGTRCVPKLGLAKTEINDALAKHAFTDASLLKIFSDHPKGILYIWSPHMPFSVKGWENISKVSKKLKMPVFPILDPHASRADLAEISKKYPKLVSQSKPLESVELLQRRVTAHYPSVVIFSESAIIGPVYPGVKSEKLYERFIIDYLEKK